MFKSLYVESAKAIVDSTESIKFILVSTKFNLIPDISAEEYKKNAS